MEFLRFGSSIPGAYWGCCAFCIIQNFKMDPDEQASIELVSGDGGQPLGDQFAGLTYKEIFETRLRIGTFNDNDMPNHGFLAVLTEWQCNSNLGKKWLQILKENGFEFIRTVDNSVYSGDDLCEDSDCDSDHKNYLFGLFRNIGEGAVQDTFTPPDAWTNIDGGVKEVNSFLTDTQRTELQNSRYGVHLEAWNNIGFPKFYTKEEVKNAGVTVTFAGQRSKFPQQPEDLREKALKANQKTTTPAPFGAKAQEAI